MQYFHKFKLLSMMNRLNKMQYINTMECHDNKRKSNTKTCYTRVIPVKTLYETSLPPTPYTI